MEVRAALPAERDEVLDLLSLWYNDRAFFALYNQNDPKFRDCLCLVARDRGELVATVQIFDRRIMLEGRPTPMGGIGSVFTREDYRHGGVASALMRLAIETMEREGFEVSLLFAERLTFYNQFGWREVPRKFSILMDTAAIKPFGDFEIEVFEAGRDLRAVMEIHRAYSGRFNVTVARDADDWRGNLIFAANQPERPGDASSEYFILARRAGEIAAYARVSRFHGVSMVMEYGYRAGAEDAAVVLFHHLGDAGSSCVHRLSGDHRKAAILTESSEGKAPPGVLITHTAHDKLIEERLTAAGAQISYHEDNNYMWRIVSPERLGGRLGLPPERAAARAFDLFKDDHSLFWTSDRF